MPHTPLTIALVGSRADTTSLRDALERRGHVVTRLAPTRVDWLGESIEGEEAAPPCDLVILMGTVAEHLRWEVFDRPELYANKLVIDMTKLETRAALGADSVLDHIEAFVPSATVVATGSVVAWKALLDGVPECVYLCGRDEEAKARVSALFRSMGCATEDVGGPQAAKLVRFLASMNASVDRNGESPLSEGAERSLELAPPTERVSFSRIHTPERFDSELIPLPSDDEAYALSLPNTPSPALSIVVKFKREVGWAQFTLQVGNHQVSLWASDASDAQVDVALESLIDALSRDALPFRTRADEEGEEVSIAVRRTSDPSMVFVSVSNLTTAVLEVIVPRATLIEELTRATRKARQGHWERPR